MQKSQLIKIALLALLLTAPVAGKADITLGTVTNASQTDTATTGTKLTIYGGVAGSLPTDYKDGIPANNCANPVTSGRYACNDRRIYPDLPLTITFRAGSKGGQPAISTTGNTPELLTLAAGSPTSVAPNEQTRITVNWQEVCEAMEDVDANCVPTTLTDAPDATFRIGIITDGGTTIDEAEAEDIKIVVSGGIGQATSIQGTTEAEDCDSVNPPVGLCHFEMIAGDKKVTLANPVGIQGFPNASPLQLRAVRVLYAKVPGATTVNAADLATYYGVYQQLNSASDFVDLTITSTSADDPRFAPGTVEGLDNDSVYVFAMAAVDRAGNVGHYSADDNTTFRYCAESRDATTQLCKVAQPGEVVGVLTESMNCFIATASYGSIFAPQVETFRQFRDRFLAKSSLGQKFIRFYYEKSPQLASYIAQSEVLRAISRVALLPFLAFAWLSLQLGAGLAAGIVISSLGILLYSTYMMVRILRAKLNNRSTQGPTRA